MRLIHSRNKTIFRTIPFILILIFSLLTFHPVQAQSSQKKNNALRFARVREGVLSVKDLVQWNLSDVRYAINELYAWYGLIFSDKEIQSVFNKKDWYKGTTKNIATIEKRFSTIEKVNLERMVALRQILLDQQKDSSSESNGSQVVDQDNSQSSEKEFSDLRSSPKKEFSVRIGAIKGDISQSLFIRKNGGKEYLLHSASRRIQYIFRPDEKYLIIEGLYFNRPIDVTIMKKIDKPPYYKKVANIDFDKKAWDIFWSVGGSPLENINSKYPFLKSLGKKIDFNFNHMFYPTVDKWLNDDEIIFKIDGDGWIVETIDEDEKRIGSWNLYPGYPLVYNIATNSIKKLSGINTPKLTPYKYLVDLDLDWQKIGLQQNNIPNIIEDTSEFALSSINDFFLQTKATLKKDEFETTSQYQERVANRFPKRVYLQINKESEQSQQNEYEPKNYSYDADTEILTLKAPLEEVPSSSESKTKANELIFMLPLDSNSYFIKSQIDDLKEFGSSEQITINQYQKTLYSILLQKNNLLDRYICIDRFKVGNQIVILIKVDSENAKEISKTGRIAMEIEVDGDGRRNYSYLKTVEDKSVRYPSKKYPDGEYRKEVIYNSTVSAKIKSILVINKDTGRIYVKLPLESK
jgi:hypothetical protein